MDTDLNRCFSKSALQSGASAAYEPRRAQEIDATLGPRFSEEAGGGTPAGWGRRKFVGLAPTGADLCDLPPFHLVETNREGLEKKRFGGCTEVFRQVERWGSLVPFWQQLLDNRRPGFLLEAMTHSALFSFAGDPL